jgi:integrase
MPRPTRDAKVDFKDARAKLKVRAKPYYCDLAEGLHLGYRKGHRKGSWVLRRKVAFGQYEVKTIGEADDGLAVADGDAILTFRQAQDAARKRAAIIDRGGASAAEPVATVASAICEYLESQEQRDRDRRGEDVTLRGDARSRLKKHVSDEKLLATALGNLTADDLKDWRLATAKIVRENTVRRATNDFKAALNAAAANYRKQAPALAAEVKIGLRAVGSAAHNARPLQILSDADIRRVLAAARLVDAADEWDGDLYRFVAVMGATGARFSQLIRMRVVDVQVDRERLTVPTSFKGRGEKSKTHVAVRIGADILEVLRPATAGRAGPDWLFLRPRRRQEAVGVWKVYGRDRWLSASELTRPWTAIRARAGLARGIVPYALRHSSIVRGLRAGLPVRLVAALHDTSAAMIEKHYSDHIVDALDELAAKAVVPLVPVEPAPNMSVR